MQVWVRVAVVGICPADVDYASATDGAQGGGHGDGGADLRVGSSDGRLATATARDNMLVNFIPTQ